MNSRASGLVEARAARARRSRALVTLPVVLASAIGLVACVDIEGGAAEMSWSLRTFAGEPVEGDPATECRTMGIEAVRLAWHLESLPDGGRPEEGRIDGVATFPCASSRGVTPFLIDEGVQVFWIEPLCDGGQLPEAGTYQVPPPILRRVARGSVVNLNAWLVVAHPRCAESGDASCQPDKTTCPARLMATDGSGN